MFDTDSTWMAYACALVIQLCLILYALTAGADFGGGLLSAFSPRDPELKRALKRMIDDAIAPIWESNHIWLIVAIVVLFVCFPTGFAWVSVGLHLPILLLLVGISLRGASFVFAHYDPRGVSVTWHRVFVISSALTPIALGVIAGSIASGQLGDTLGPLSGPSHSLSLERAELSLWWSAWLSPFTLMVGLMTTALFAWLAAIYLYAEALGGQSEALLELDEPRRAEAARALRVRAYGAQLTLALTASLSLLTVESGVIRDRLLWGSYAPMIHVWVGLSAIGALIALTQRRALIARALGASQAVGIVAGWSVASLPHLIPDQLTITAAAAQPATLKATLICVAIALTLVLPSLWWLMRIFKRRVEV